MIRFTDNPIKLDKIENLDNLNSFKEISPKTISKTEAHEFWDGVFEESIEENVTIEDIIIRDVYGRSEDEFSFDFDVMSEDIQEALVRFRTENWENLSEQEKETAIIEFEKAIAEKLGLKNIPAIEFYEAEPWDCGAFNLEENIIRINKNNMDDPEEMVNTIAHEIRHAYQYERACNIESYEDFLYAYNFSNYITPLETEDGYINYMEYQDQLIEAEARAFAGLFDTED